MQQDSGSPSIIIKRPGSYLVYSTDENGDPGNIGYITATIDTNYSGNVKIRVQTYFAGAGANDVGSINLTDLKSGNAYSSVENSTITGSLGSVSVTRVGSNGGFVSFSGGIDIFNGTISGAHTIQMSPTGSATGTISCNTLTISTGGNYAVNTTCSILGPLSVGGSLTGNITLNGNNTNYITVSNTSSGVINIHGNSSGAITIGTLSGAVRVDGNITGSVTIGTIASTGSIAADYDNANGGSISSNNITVTSCNGNVCDATTRAGGWNNLFPNITWGSSGTVCGQQADCNGNQLLESDFNSDGTPDDCQCNTPPQDSNGDSHVDANDFDTFSMCYNGPTNPYSPALECVCMDSNGDLHVDSIDFDAFSACYNGPTNPPACLGGNRNMMLAESTTESSSPEVAFDLEIEQAGQSLTAATPVAWNVAVVVTGTSNGLAGYSLALALHQGTASGPLAGITLAMPTFSDSFHVGENGFTTLYNPLVAGGPLMVGMISTGSNTTPGKIAGIGAGYGMPWTYTFAETRMTWGIGLDSRKAALLDSTSADYVLNSGTIDTTGLSPGHYVLTLTPQWARVLRDELDFEQDIEQSFMRPAHSISEPDTVEFDIAQ